MRDAAGPTTAAGAGEAKSGVAATAAGLIRDLPAHSTAAAADEAAFSDLASATFRPAMVNRERYLTIAQRCSLGTADPSLRCSVDRVLGGSAPTPADDAPPAFSISGRVITSDGFGVAGVTLIASRIGNADDLGESDSSATRYTRYRAVSAADGSYAFEDIPDGDYTIRSNRHDAYASQRITARAGVRYADLILEEELTVIVEGRITDEYGLPLSHVSVLPVVAGAASVRSDRSGAYRLPVSISPRAGRITLRFESPGFHEASMTADVPAVADNAFEAASIELDAVLRAIELTTNVSGTVTDAEGDAIAGRIVELVAVGEQYRLQTVTDRNGRYKFPVVDAPLAYQLRVNGAPDHADYSERVQVTRYDYEFDVVMEAYEYGTLRGRVLDTDGVPIPHIELRYRNTSSSKANAVVRSDSAGNFVLTDAPAGDAILASQSMPNFVVRGLSVERGRESTVEVVLDAGGHELAGRVLDRLGRPVPASDVILNWAHEADGIKSSATRRTATDSFGSFRFDQLGPGPHSLVVNAPGFAPATFDHDIGQDGYSVTVRLH